MTSTAPKVTLLMLQALFASQAEPGYPTAFPLSPPPLLSEVQPSSPSPLAHQQSVP